MNGTLEIITGCMFAGKTSALIARYHSTKDNSSFVIFRHARDTRYGDGCIRAHNGDRLNAVSVRRAFDFAEHVGKAAVDFVLIDEAQFYDPGDLHLAIASMLSNRSFRILVAGLQYKYNGQPFRWLGLLSPLARSVTFLRATCAYCAQAAEMQHCKSGKIVNGGPADYVPICRACMRSVQGARR